MRRLPGVTPTELDRALPAYSFREIHRVRLTRSIQNVPDLFKSLTWQEAPGFHRVITVAGLGIHRFDSGDRIIAMFLNGPYRVIFEARHEIVLGALISKRSPLAIQPNSTEAQLNAFRRASLSGTIKVATSFTERGGFLWTETRVLPIGRVATMLFAPYWYAIRLGGGFIRQSWLKGLKARAERAAPPEIQH